MMGTMLMGERDTITLRVKGDGPLEGGLAGGNAKGEVKGYSVYPGAVLPDKVPGKLNVGGAVGM